MECSSLKFQGLHQFFSGLWMVFSMRTAAVKGRRCPSRGWVGYFRTEVRVEHRFYLVDRLQFLTLANTKSQREAKLWTLLSAKNDHPQWEMSRNEISYSSKVMNLFTWGNHLLNSYVRSFLFLIPGPHHEEESG